MLYFVMELVAGRWFTVRSFSTLVEAETFTKGLSRKTKIVARNL